MCTGQKMRRLRNLEDFCRTCRSKKCSLDKFCVCAHCVQARRRFSWSGARPKLLAAFCLALPGVHSVWKPVEQVSSKTINCKSSTPAQYPITRPIENQQSLFFQACLNCVCDPSDRISKSDATFCTPPESALES
jgi:hypothetical protein